MQQIEESAARKIRRYESLPVPVYSDDLPVVLKREEIAAAIRDHQVIVLCGETGSGKTTQIPKILLDLHCGIEGLIGHTQPRRVAARSVARRIAQEIQSPLGRAVGYKVRFSDFTSPDCYIKLMTDGILLAETQGDPLLYQYDTIIIDEAHERSLNIDFLLGYIKRILPKRPDLKIIIMSATIDPERFSTHFDNAPIVEVTGRTYPVEMRYRPVVDDTPNQTGDTKTERTMQDAILDAVDELDQCDRTAHKTDGYRTSGDILIFLPGERDIRETAESLRKHHPPETEILPFYARLSASEQDRVFKAHSGRRIVLATNVAETSLTVPGIRYVIDPGYARISRYRRSTKVQGLPIEPISQASANQRAGRCGRLSAGVCIRIYSEEDYKQRPEFTEPEILRSNLAGVILQMKSLHLGKVEQFPFLEAPDSRFIRDGYQTLHELGAMDEKGNLTSLGKMLSRLPVDPRIGRLLLAGATENALNELLIIASALSIRDPRERPVDHQAAADQSHAEFRETDSDFLSYINLWNYYHEQVKHLSNSKLRKLCKKRYISYLRMREWEDIHTQLKTLMRQLGHSLNDTPADYDSIHLALLAGLLSNIGNRRELYEYTGPRSIKFNIFPGSALFKSRPKWIVSAELVRTTKLFARCVARIQPAWIESVAPHLLKRTYSEPHYEMNGERVSAYERVTLWGLPIIERRSVNFGPIDPEQSRSIFIQHALVMNEYRTGAEYQKHNINIIHKAEEFKARTRRHDLMYDDSLLFAFFNTRIPKDIYNGPLFEKWRRKAERNNKRILFMHLADVLGESGDEDVRRKYPDYFIINKQTHLPLHYCCDPASNRDGVTAIIPLEILPSLHPAEFDRLVPGLLPEKIHALLRSLPKSQRTCLQPVSEFIDSYISWYEAKLLEYKGNNTPVPPLTQSIIEFAKQTRGLTIDIKTFRVDTLPPYLFMRYEIRDRHKKTITAGRDLDNLRTQLQPKITKALHEISDSSYNQTGLTNWNIATIPESVEVNKNRLSVRAYPALVDEGKSAGLRLFQSLPEAQSHHRAGLRRLAMLELDHTITNQSKNLPNFGEMSLHYATLGSSDELRTELLELIADHAFFSIDNNINIRTKENFNTQLALTERRWYDAVTTCCSTVKPILRNYHEIDILLEKPYPHYCEESLKDIELQLGHLLRKRFLITTPFNYLQQYPRYLSAIIHRLQKLPRGNADLDCKRTQEVARYWNAYLELEKYLKQYNQIPTQPVIEFRYLIEEYRISLFAQHLGTAAPVSPKRLDQKWQNLSAALQQS